MAGKAGKTRQKQKRKMMKQAAKAGRQRHYQELAARGDNSKSTARDRRSKPKLRPRTHPFGNCGNLGCQTCSGTPYSNFLVNGKAVNMPQRMWQKWIAL